MSRQITVTVNDTDDDFIYRTATLHGRTVPDEIRYILKQHYKKPANRPTQEELNTVDLSPTYIKKLRSKKNVAITRQICPYKKVDNLFI